MLEKIAAVVVGLIGGLALAIGLSALFAWPVQALWNYLSASGFWPILPSGAQHLSFYQAWGLSLLCSLLFKSSK